MGSAKEVLLGEIGHNYHHQHDTVEPYIVGEVCGDGHSVPREETTALHSAMWEKEQTEMTWELPMSGL